MASCTAAGHNTSISFPGADHDRRLRASTIPARSWAIYEITTQTAILGFLYSGGSYTTIAVTGSVDNLGVTGLTTPARSWDTTT